MFYIVSSYQSAEYPGRVHTQLVHAIPNVRQYSICVNTQFTSITVRVNTRLTSISSSRLYPFNVSTQLVHINIQLVHVNIQFAAMPTWFTSILSSRQYPVRDYTVLKLIPSSPQCPVSSRQYQVSSRQYPFSYSNTQFALTSTLLQHPDHINSLRQFPVSSCQYPVQFMSMPVRVRTHSCQYSVRVDTHFTSISNWPRCSRCVKVRVVTWPPKVAQGPLTAGRMSVSAVSELGNWTF